MKWQVKRARRSVSYSLTLQLLLGITETVWQVTNCREISEVGSHPLILGKTSTSPADPGTAELGSGSFKPTRSRNGRRSERAPFYGSMANVSRRPAVTLSHKLKISPL